MQSSTAHGEFTGLINVIRCSCYFIHPLFLLHGSYELHIIQGKDIFINV